MKIKHLAIAIAATFGLGLGAAPVVAQPGPGHHMDRRGPDHGPGAHRPRARAYARANHRRRQVCRTVYRHGHRERRCNYR